MSAMTSELLFDEDGNPEQRFLPLDVVVVPRLITLSGNDEWLEVEDDEEYWHGIGRARQVTTDTLSRFIQLADQPVARIFQFAKQWGLLGLCKHDQPATHHLEDRNGHERPVLLPYDGCTPEPVESISAWRTYSRRFRTFLEVGQLLHRGESIPDTAVWKHLGDPHRAFYVGRSRDSLHNQKERFARAVNLQLAAAAVQPIVQWGRLEPSIHFGVFGAVRTSLFAALSMQLAFTVSDCKIAICAACHQTYRPARRAHRGQRGYCSECRHAGVDVRVRVQRLRDRRRVTAD